jgi:hypothetical protein
VLLEVVRAQRDGALVLGECGLVEPDRRLDRLRGAVGPPPLARFLERRPACIRQAGKSERKPGVLRHRALECRDGALEIAGDVLPRQERAAGSEVLGGVHRRGRVAVEPCAFAGVHRHVQGVRHVSGRAALQPEHLGAGTGGTDGSSARTRGVGPASACIERSAAVAPEADLDPPGEYRVKNPGLQALHGEARRLVWELGRVRFEHVRREFNAHADRLANEAMDGKK